MKFGSTDGTPINSSRLRFGMIMKNGERMLIVATQMTVETPMALLTEADLQAMEPIWFHPFQSKPRSATTFGILFVIFKAVYKMAVLHKEQDADSDSDSRAVTTANDVLPSQQVEEVAQKYGFNERVKEAIANTQKPGPYGTYAFGSMPSVPQMIWNWLPSFKDVWMWTCCLVVTLKVFLTLERLLRMGLRRLGIQIGEQVRPRRRKRAVEKVRLSDLRQRSPVEEQEQDADNEEEEENKARQQNSPWPPTVSLDGMSRSIAIQ
uniref:Uncharacterized protein n=1 Tax=Ditylenchus dipsaci TaxID=166011 RepID=A0A915E8I1_9BILA